MDRPRARVELTTPGSAWSPLKIRVFRWLWIAGLASNVGTFMHNAALSRMRSAYAPL